MFGALRPSLGVAFIFLLPVSVFAQGTIAGTIRNTSGGVLPGVAVEAASPVLIEKVRTALSDDSGQYRIENLRPGVYIVRFVLAGFSTVVREGVELTGSLTATINADLRVGELEETLTVVGETPVVDLQSAQRETVMNNEFIKAIPTAGSYNSLLVLVPGLFGGQQDVATGPCNSCTFSAHGTVLSSARANRDGRLLQHGSPKSARSSISDRRTLSVWTSTGTRLRHWSRAETTTRMRASKELCLCARASCSWVCLASFP